MQEAVLIRSAHGIGALLSEEAPHGHQALGGTILPTNLAMGATFDPEAVRQAQEAVAGGTGGERRAACTSPSSPGWIWPAIRGGGAARNALARIR